MQVVDYVTALVVMGLFTDWLELHSCKGGFSAWFYL